MPVPPPSLWPFVFLCHFQQSLCSTRTNRCSPTSTPLMRGSTCRAGPAAAAPSLTWCWTSGPKAPGPGRAWRPTLPLSSSSVSCVRPPGTNWKWRPATVPVVATRAPSLPRLIMMAVSACIVSHTLLTVVVSSLVLNFLIFSSFLPLLSTGTIPPIKSARGEGDDVKKLFSIGSPVILVTLGVALLFIIRKKRKEKRLKRLRGERPERDWCYSVWCYHVTWCDKVKPLSSQPGVSSLRYCLLTDAKSLAEMLIR